MVLELTKMQVLLEAPSAPLIYESRSAAAEPHATEIDTGPAMTMRLYTEGIESVPIHS
jgi:hypothetical protein